MRKSGRFSGQNWQNRSTRRSRNSIYGGDGDADADASVLSDGTLEQIPRTEQGWWNSLGNEHVVNKSTLQQYESIVVQKRESVRIYTVQDEEDSDDFSLASLPDMSSTFVATKRKSGFFKKPIASKRASEPREGGSALTEFYNRALQPARPSKDFSFFPEDRKSNSVSRSRQSVCSDDLSDISFGEMANNKRVPLFRRTDTQNKQFERKIADLDNDSDKSELFDYDSPAKPVKLLFSTKPVARKSIFLKALSTSSEQNIERENEDLLIDGSKITSPEITEDIKKSTLSQSLHKEVDEDEMIFNISANKEVSAKTQQKSQDSQIFVDKIQDLESTNFLKDQSNIKNKSKYSKSVNADADKEISKFMSQQSQESNKASQTTIDSNMPELFKNGPNLQTKSLFKLNKDKPKITDSIFAEALSTADVSVITSQASDNDQHIEDEIANNSDVSEDHVEIAVQKSIFADDPSGQFISFNRLNHNKHTPDKIAKLSQASIGEQDMDVEVREPSKTKSLFNKNNRKPNRLSTFASALENSDSKHSQDEVIVNSQPDNTDIHQKTNKFESSMPLKTKQLFKNRLPVNQSVFAAALSDTEKSISLAHISNLSKHTSENADNDIEEMDVDHPIHAADIVSNVKESTFLKAVAEFEMDDQNNLDGTMSKRNLSQTSNNDSRSKRKKSGVTTDVSHGNNTFDSSKPPKPKILFNNKRTANIRNSIFAAALSDSEESIQEGAPNVSTDENKMISSKSRHPQRLSLQKNNETDAENENNIRDKMDSSPTSSVASDTANFDRWRQLASSTMISTDGSPNLQNKTKNKPRLSRLYHSSKKFEIHSDIMEETESESKNSDSNSKNLESAKKTEKITNLSNIRETEKEKEKSIKLSKSWTVIGNMSGVKEDLPEAVRNAKVFTNTELSIENIALSSSNVQTNIQSPKMKRQSVGTWLRMEDESGEKSVPLNQSDIDRQVFEEMMARRTNPPVRRSNEAANITMDNSEIIENEEADIHKSRMYPLRHSNVPINTYNIPEVMSESQVQEKLRKTITKSDKTVDTVVGSLVHQQSNYETLTNTNVDEQANLKMSITTSDKTEHNMSLAQQQSNVEINDKMNDAENLILEADSATEKVNEEELSIQTNLIENENPHDSAVVNENSQKLSKSSSKLRDSIFEEADVVNKNDSRRTSNRLKQNSQFLEKSINKDANFSVLTEPVQELLNTTENKESNQNLLNDIQPALSVDIITKQNMSANDIEHSEMEMGSSTLNIGGSFQKNLEEASNSPIPGASKTRRSSARISRLPTSSETSQSAERVDDINNSTIKNIAVASIKKSKNITSDFVEPGILTDTNNLPNLSISQSQVNSDFIESNIGISFQRNMMSSMVNVTEVNSTAGKLNLSKLQQSVMINEQRKDITENPNNIAITEKSQINTEESVRTTNNTSKKSISAIPKYLTPAKISSPKSNVSIQHTGRRSNRLSMKDMNSPIHNDTKLLVKEPRVDDSKHSQMVDDVNMDIVEPVVKPTTGNLNNKRISHYMPPDDTLILRLPTESIEEESRNSTETTRTSSQITKNQSNIDKSVNEPSEATEKIDTLIVEKARNLSESDKNLEIENEIQQADILETDVQNQDSDSSNKNDEPDVPGIDQSEFENHNQSEQINKGRFSIKYHSNMFLDFNAMSTPKQARKSVRISLPGKKIPMMNSRLEFSKRTNTNATEPSIGSSIDASNTKTFNLTVNNSEKIFQTPGKKRNQSQTEESTSQVNSNVEESIDNRSNDGYEMSGDYDENPEDNDISQASAEDPEVDENKLFSSKNKSVYIKKADQAEIDKYLEKWKSMREAAKTSVDIMVKNALSTSTKPVYNFVKPPMKMPVMYNKKPQILKISKPTTNKNKPKRKLYMKEQWINPRLYKFVQNHLVDKYGVKTDTRSERFVKDLANVVTLVSKTKTDYYKYVETLRSEMARLNLVVSYRDFHDFIRDYLPYTFRMKSIPSIGRDIPFLKCSEDAPILQ